MSKFVTLERLSRFWVNAKDYIDNGLSGKAAATHTHDYAAATHNHAQTEINGLADALAGKAPTSHAHAQSDITGLSDALAGKAAASHTHTQYAAAAHTHTEYAAAAHGHDEYARKSDITNAYIYKGSKATFADLPATGNTAGDVWNVEADGGNYAWTGTAWDALGGSFTIDVATEAEIDALFA